MTVPKEGIFAVYKPKGPTSNDVLKSIRKIARTKKVGHAGTLDPLAEGVLVVGIGREATKKLKDVVKKEKEYIARIRFGITSATDDEEGEKKTVLVSAVPSETTVAQVIQNFKGSIRQKPPVYSAVKVGGKEAYKRARKGETVELKERIVEVKDIEVLQYRWPYADIRVVTGPGVYIRALARDVGEKLGTGGYLVSLQRTRIGVYTKDHSIAFSELKQGK